MSSVERHNWTDIFVGIALDASVLQPINSPAQILEVISGNFGFSLYTKIKLKLINI